MPNTVSAPKTSTTSKTVLRLPQVIKKTGLGRATLYAYIKKNQFPAPFPLTERSVGWLESSVDTWIDNGVHFILLFGGNP